MGLKKNKKFAIQVTPTRAFLFKTVFSVSFFLFVAMSKNQNLKIKESEHKLVQVQESLSGQQNNFFLIFFS